MRTCGRTGLIVLCLMLVMVSGLSCEAEHNLKEVADIWQHLNTFRDTITVDRAKNPDNLKKLTITVDQDIDLLRKRLKEQYGTIPEGVSILKYLPKGPVLDGSVDYREAFQKAINENKCVVIPGSNDPKKPNVYGISIDPSTRSGILIPDGHILVGQPHATIKRLPSTGVLIRVGKGARLIGITADGNKAAHWPAFKDNVGKDGGVAVYMMGGCVVQDCTVYDSPGHAFATHRNDNIVMRCVGRNCGYIDLRYNATFYRGKWDKWSGDAFYIRGYNNLVIDCEAYDCFRWGYTTCHAKSGGSTFINCTMKNALWETYGFIDIEGCYDDWEGTVLINMKSTQGSIAISTNNTRVINCESGRITVYNADNTLIAGCTTHGGGLGIGGWTSTKNAYVRGGNSPVVIDNTIVKSGVGSGIDNVSDWSLSVYSTDGKGIAVNNVLKEYKGKLGTGPGMKFNKVATANNRIKYGVWLNEETTQTKAQ
ncbi:MAG TPA: hypothetical protein ENH85_15295 [Candidatus Scalindua sp.]|nr:hypothetical protein [Candidatus Scalindua sp.]